MRLNWLRLLRSTLHRERLVPRSRSDPLSFPDTGEGRALPPQLSPTGGGNAAHIQDSRRRVADEPAPHSEYRSECLSVAKLLAGCRDDSFAACRGDRRGGPKASPTAVLRESAPGAGCTWRRLRAEPRASARDGGA